MVNYSAKFIPIYTIGFLECQVPESLLVSLREETNSMIQKEFEGCIPYNYGLAGNIQKEFALQNNVKKLEEFVCSVAPLYWKAYKSNQATKKHYLRYNERGEYDVWVNFQKKGEYNPIHQHSGALSFVIYLNVPYTLEQERTYGYTRANNFHSSGVFEFVYVDQYLTGGINSFPVPTDKKFEGKMIMFCSSLNHLVYPFHSSDEYRITIAGNIDIEV